MESAATAESTTVEAASAAIAMSYAASGITMRNSAARVSVRATCITVAAITVSAAIAVASAIAEAATHVVAGVTVEAPVVPRPDADEEAAVKPVWAVITIRCAGVRVIGVIAPLTIRGTVISWSGNHCRAHSNPHRDLGIRCRYNCKGKNHKHC
jgi:hypothetical protein